ncbi:zinc-ribbon domain containing protein [Desulfotomaculum copahuensis]|uniref:Zinc-binding protein n=1 Tax=Desulfotomaculum copahuensis TaxID=1838280 RepID=A0A1B7LIF7_9FIRM|nr:zinc-ribbon domain containing protein [Desulfotomaculum copahuensis]OAT86358.1 zinc-binding protein [Desulfotomaculum copahuensis]
MFEDKVITCRDCGQEFVFTVSEQEFYAEKGFTNDPSRCPQCRAARKQNGGNRGRGRYDRQEREMFPAVCAACGRETQVPFQPREDRPVYCRDCFSRRNNRY